MMESKTLANMIIEAIEKTKSTEKKEQWEAISEAIVKFLKTNVDVIPTSFAAPSGGGAVTGKGNLQ